jgi:hypothetical protein
MKHTFKVGDEVILFTPMLPSYHLKRTNIISIESDPTHPYVLECYNNTWFEERELLSIEVFESPLFKALNEN